MKHIALVALLVALVGVACSSSEEMAVEEPWGRPSPMNAGNAAFYMDITGGAEDDTLVAAATDACGVVELHESSMSDDGVMSMQHLPQGIPIPAGETVVLEPAGLHVMCMMVTEPLETGSMVDLTLEFATGDSIAVQVEIREG